MIVPWSARVGRDAAVPATTPRQRLGSARRDRGRRLVCARCRLPITSDDARIDMGGSHEHTVTNPHGHVFHIGCFASAPGCAAVTPAESHFSWFPGYRWQIAACRGCHLHLGWRFIAAATRFHGLILDRLAPESEPPRP
jgi:hypothetical protein